MTPGADGPFRLLAEIQALAELGVWEWTPATNRLAWSDDLYRLLGLTPGELHPTFEALIARAHPEDRANLERYIGRACRERGPVHLEHRIVRPDGELRTLRGRARGTFDDLGALTQVTGIVQDITAEPERRQPLTPLALTGIAHEINNPLATLATQIELLAERRSDAPGTWLDEAALAESQLAIERIRSVVRGLTRLPRAATEPGPPESEPPRERGRASTVVAAPPPVVARDPRQRGRVLIVDDEIAYANALRRLLAREHEVIVVTSGRDALTRFESGERYDVILCDLMMPEMTGADLHIALLKLDPTQAEQMIFVTGGAFNPASQYFLENINNLCFEKPCDLQELRAAVRQYVSRRL